MAILDDSVDFTIKVWSQKGSIVSFAYPEEAVPGDPFTITAAVLNSSTESEGYVLMLVPQDGGAMIDSEAFNLAAGEQEDVIQLSGTMATTAMNLRLQLWRDTA